MSRNPTRTTNRLHFADLAPQRFEDLCLGLIYGLLPWSDIRHYGRVGSDKGIDILARESLEDESERTWFVQCRRYKRAPKKTLTTAIDDTLAKLGTRPDVLLVIVSCDVSRQAQEGFDEHAHLRGIARAILWTESVLEAKLYAERRDLLFSYFGVSMAAESRSREWTLKRGIAMKRQVMRELMRPVDDPRRALRNPSERFVNSRMVIHSVDDSSYPRGDDVGAGISGWFRIEPFDLYHNGIEFALNIEYALLDRHGNWATVPYDYPAPDEGFAKVKVWHIGCLPFRNIVAIDTLGDEYYNEPHIYCRFSEGGEPYEEFRYRLCDESSFPAQLEAERRLPLEELAKVVK